MGWFRVYSNVGGSLVVRAESREEAIKQVWVTLEELTRGAVEGLRRGSYIVAEERIVGLERTHHPGFELHALVYVRASQRPCTCTSFPGLDIENRVVPVPPPHPGHAGEHDG